MGSHLGPLRYLGLETMARLATNLSTHEYLDRRRKDEKMMIAEAEKDQN